MVKFGTSKREDPVFLESSISRKLGSTAPGVTYNLGSSFGNQASSRNSTAPSFPFGLRSSLGMGGKG